MPYIRREIHFKNGDVRVEKYFSLRYGIKRYAGARLNSTSDKQKEINKKRAAQKREDLIYNNFGEGDWWITLTYPRELRPRFEEAHIVFTKFLAKVKRKYKMFKYIGCTDDNIKGNNAHHHGVFSWGGATDKKGQQLNGFDLLEMWRKHIGINRGGGKVERIYNTENGDLARYFNKETPKTYDADGNATSVVEKKFTGSRNLDKPVVIKRVIKNNTWRKVPAAKKGYEVKDVYNGFDFVGFEKQTYILRKRC